MDDASSPCLRHQLAPVVALTGPVQTLQGFPGTKIQLPDQAQILQPQSQGLLPQERSQLIDQCAAALRGACLRAEAEGRAVERLLLILPDKTRTQMAANLLLDGVLALVAQQSLGHPLEQVTLLYGLGTHPLMEEKDIERLITPDRLQRLTTLGLSVVQQTTKAVTTPLAFVTVWQDHPHQEVVEADFHNLREPLLMAWAAAEQRDATLWLGCFPEGVAAQRQDWLELLRSLHQSRPQGARPLEIDCRDPHLNQWFQENLGPGVADTLHFHLARPDWGQESDQVREVRFVDRHGDGQWCLRGGDRYTIEVPELLFTHDLIVVAGDTRIHPYEGRYGSGGINKMLAVGIASMNEIRRSHSTQILMNPLTRVGEPRSPFVQRIAATARSIRDTLSTRPGSRSLAHPYGLTVIGQSEEAIWRMAFGQEESLRHSLAHTLTQRYTVPVRRPLDVVISDVEPHKGTDITAGARALQYLCDWHRPHNLLLHQPDRGCVALLFNPCGEPKNNQGIGNDGTKLHMDVLGELLQRVQPQLTQSLGQITTAAHARQLLSLTRQTVLGRWQHHLCSVSEATEWLLELQRLARTGYHQSRQGEVTRDLTRYLQEQLDRYSRGANHVNRAIATISYQFQQSQDWHRLLTALRETAHLYQEHEGLGEGGQRTLRLLRLCRTFMTLGIATRQPAVVDYLQWLDPDMTAALPDTVQATYRDMGLRASVLGIVPVDLNHHTPEDAVTLALRYGQWHKPEIPNLSVGFLTRPLILRQT